MPILWNTTCDNFKWLPIRFYFYLSNNKISKRIYFNHYLDKIYKQLWENNKKM